MSLIISRFLLKYGILETPVIGSRFQGTKNCEVSDLRQVRETLELLADECIFIRVEKIAENGDVTATFWSSCQDPVVPEVIALEKIC